MLQNVLDTQIEVSEFIINSPETLEQFRLLFLSKKGKVSLLFDQFKSVPNDQKKEFGQKLNILKTIAQDKLNNAQASFTVTKDTLDIDFSLPGDSFQIGSRHPLSIVKNKINEIFNRIGFTIADGPEIEDDWHVFSALNFPPDHPARDMQDTFFIEKNPDIL